MLSLPDFKEKSLLFIHSANYHLRFANENLVVEEKKGGKLINQVSCHKLFAVVVVGSATYTTSLLEKAQHFGFTLMFTKDTFLPYAILGSVTEGNTLLRKRQYQAVHSHLIAEHLVRNKIQNQIANLKDLRAKGPSLKADLKKLLALYDKIGEQTQSNEQLLSVEGNASKLYFKHYFMAQEWKARRPRTRIDPLNATLDAGYTMLFCFIEVHLRLYGFDLYQGVYHRLFYQRKSLVCDLVEPFRPLIDRAVKNAFALRTFQNDDFIHKNSEYSISIKERRKFTKVFAEALLGEKEEIFLYVQQYYRAFIREKELSAYPIHPSTLKF